MPETQFTLDLALVLLAALGGGLLAYVLKQPLFLGYILGGALIGPFTPGPHVTNVELIEQLAEIGVVLLMFTMGLEFSLKELIRVRTAAVGGGLLGIGAMIGLFVSLRGVFALTFDEALFLGAAISVSSTMVIAKLLMEREALNTEHGHLMIGTLLVEDLAVVLMLMILPALGGAGGLAETRLVDLGSALLKGAAILVPVLWLATYVVPSLIGRIARTRDVELFILVALVLSLGTGVVTAQLGLSPAMGAFLAGLIIGESEFVHETLARILPLRDLFVALFFVSIGMLIDPRIILNHLPLHVALVLLVVVGKGMIRGVLTTLFRYPLRVAFMVTLGFTQIGEFTFVLARVGVDEGVISFEHYNVLLASSLLTIFLSTFLFRSAPSLWHRMSERLPGLEAPAGGSALADAARDAPRGGHVIVCGYGRMGSAVGESLERFGIPHVILETDPRKVTRLKERGIPVIFGDAANERVCRAAHPQKAALAVIALPDFFHARQVFRHLKRLNPELPIVARAHWGPEREELFREGVTEVIQPEFEGAIEMIRHALIHARVDALEMEPYLHELRQQRYSRLLRAWLQREDPAHRTQKIQEIEIPKGSPLAGHSLRECRIRERTGVSVLEIRRKDGRILPNPAPDTVFESGDRALVMGSPTQLIGFLEMVRPPDLG